MDAKQYQTEYRKAHKERMNAQCREYYQKHRKELLADKTRYFKKNKKRIYEYQKEWRDLNREHVRERNRRWEKNNPDKRQQSANESYHRHKERNRVRRLKRAHLWYLKNKDHVVPAKRAARQKQVAELRAQLFAHYGSKCNCCGLADTRFLSVDHVNCGIGNKAPKKDRATIYFYKMIVAMNFPADYQILCINCNWAKGRYGVCHHQIDKELELGKGVHSRL